MPQSEYDDAEGVVLEAGGELFTVNRCRLVQDSLVFRDMFALASADDSEGTVSHPLPTGEDATMFRDFLWALRVRPGKLMAFVRSTNSPEKAIKLINIARLAHKYQDSELSDWALEQLHETLSPGNFPLAEPMLTPLIDALVTFNDSEEKPAALHTLLKQRIDEAAKSTTANVVDLVELVAVCTANDCTSLLPTAYYALLIVPRQIRWVDDSRLTESTKRQLLRGAWRLSEEWHWLRQRCPAAIPFIEKTQNYAVPGPHPADLLGRLRTLPELSFTQKGHSASPSYYEYNLGRTVNAGDYVQIIAWRAEVDAIIAGFADKLRDYFGLVDTSPPEV